MHAFGLIWLCVGRCDADVLVGYYGEEGGGVDLEVEW
jgi:hypothetical protein